MFTFKEWENRERTEKRVYLKHASIDSDKFFIHLTKSTGDVRIGVSARIPGSSAIINQLDAALNSHGFNTKINYQSWDKMVDALFKIPGKHSRKTMGSASFTHSDTSGSYKTAKNGGTYAKHRPPALIAEETYRFSLDSVKCKKSTLNDVLFVVDSREPGSLRNKLEEGGFDVVLGTLPVGDIHIVSKTSSDVLIIERKTVTDLSLAIQDDATRRFHSQAERLFKYQNDRARENIRVRVVWMIECEQNGDRGLYDTLNESRQVDGVVNYLSVILGQHIVVCYNMHHLGYLAMKFAQGYFEKELFYKATTANQTRVDGDETDHAESILVAEDDAVHGVYVKSNLMGTEAASLKILMSYPGINVAIAKSLLATGKKVNEIIRMSEDELVKVKSIGKVSAKKIFDGFSL